ncbi:synaptophysin-like protein 1 [Spea bombifrons]|uniref:synaptophysin-like protein 1 n=1 Tax=Spea bombifrons TaxID=233779 RepID=UPI00234AECD4|nr:synaptophysin-like protein 1 [Spea bombifrons]
MSRLTQKMSALQLSFTPLKEPLGFIKVLEWVFSIFSFATCGGYSGKTDLSLSCANESYHLNKTIEATFMYPFRLSNVIFQGISGDFCGSQWKDFHLTGDYSSSAQFYVTIAVFAFLYSMGALVLYLGFRQLYENSPKLPLIDFIITVIFAFMWLVSSSAWAKGLTDIKLATSPQTIAEYHCNKTMYKCSPGTESHMGSLNISVAFGFLNLILWAGNAWFVYKETNLHTAPPEDGTQGPGNIPAPSSM